MTRIAWSEAARPRGGEDVELENPDSDVEGEAGASTSAVAAKGTATDGARSLEDNKCYLVWEGMLRNRMYNNFKAKSNYKIQRSLKTEYLGYKKELPSHP